MDKTVEAIILAGGKGTRLAPLTEDTPKPLLKIMGKTVLETVFDRLNDCGIKKATVTTMYLPWQIENLGNKHGNLTVNYVREQTPLGTAGAVKNAYDGHCDTVLVMSGDGLCDFDLKAAIDFHFEKNADVTIVTYNTENPLEYGVVLYGSDGRISRFAEKPPWAQVVSGTVNTGIYIINKNILDRIPENTEFDFSKQLFPLLLAQKYALYAFEAKGNWHDIGNLDSYFSANCSALDGKISGLSNNGMTEKELADKHIEVELPVFVSRGAVVGQNVKLGAYTVIGDGAVISDGCDIACSVISDGVELGLGCGIYGTLIGRNTKLGENCVTSEGCAIGANAKADDSVILPKYSLIHSGAHITCQDYICGHSGRKERSIFGENGICCDSDSASPEYILHIGYTAAHTVSSHKTLGTTRVGVMCDDNSHSARISSIILNGIMSAGVRSIDFGRGFEAMARFAALEFISDIVIYVSRDSKGHTSAKIFDGYGLAVSGDFEREFTNEFYGSAEYSVPDRFYETDRFTDLWTLYYSRLVSECRDLLGGDTLDGLVCSFAKSGDIQAYSPAYTALYAISELGGRVKREPDRNSFCFDIDETGTQARSEYLSSTLDEFHMRAVIINNLSSETAIKNLYLPSSFPDIYRTLAEKKGVNVKEYALSDAHNDKVLSKNALRGALWLNDGVFLILRFAVLVCKNGTDAVSLTKQIPSFEVYSRRFEGNANRAGVMQRLIKLAANEKTHDSSEKGKKEGVKLVLPGGSVTIIPGKVSGFRIISEARSIEAAKELCDQAEEYLK